MVRRTYSGGVVKRTVLSGGVVERTVLSGGVVERTVLSGGIAPAATGPVLPAWVTHAWEDPGVADGAPISTHTDLISGVVAASSGTARPTWREDYAGTGVAAVEWDGVDDVLSTVTPMDLTGGYTYCALVFFDSPIISNRVLFDNQNHTQVYAIPTVIRITQRTPSVTSIQGSFSTTGQWVVITAINSGATGEIFSNRTSLVTGPVNVPTVADIVRFGRGASSISTGGMKGAIAAHYFGPPTSPAQRTEIWDYVNARHGVAL